ncbi:Acetyl-coenzyme A carboxylase carboxyl transferase subunit alpha [compost metagenome]
MLSNGLIDGIIPEPLGGAHQDPAKAAANLKEQLLKDLAELTAKDSDTLIKERIDKFSNMGVVTE